MNELNDPNKEDVFPSYPMNRPIAAKSRDGLTLKSGIADIKEVAIFLYNTPTVREYDQYGKWTRRIIERALGLKWNEFVAKANLPIITKNKRKNNRKRLSDGQLAADIKRVAKTVGHCPTTLDYEKYGKYSCATIRNRFGSWKLAIESFGLRYTPFHSKFSRYTDDDIKRDLSRVQQIVKHIPSAEEYKQHGKYACNNLYVRANKTKSWSNVLIHFLRNVDLDIARQRGSRNKRFIPRKEYEDKIKDLAKRLRRTPRSIDCVRNKIYLHRFLTENDTTYHEFIEQMGLPKVIDRITKRDYLKSKTANRSSIVADANNTEEKSA